MKFMCYLHLRLNECGCKLQLHFYFESLAIVQLISNELRPLSLFSADLNLVGNAAADDGLKSNAN